MPRIHIAIAFHFSPDYLPAFKAALNGYADLGPWEKVFHILTNSDDEADHELIRTTCADLVGERTAVSVLAFPDLEHPFLLTWQHKQILRKSFLTDPGAELFLYAEHDIVVTRKTVEHFLWAREVLRPFGLLPGFVRFEYAETGNVNVVDFTEILKLRKKGLIVVGGKCFALDYQPYCAFFLLDRELAEEHIGSPAFHEEYSRELSGWEIRERATLGALHTAVPEDRAHRYALLLDRHYQPDDATWVWHATNNYAGNTLSPHGKIPMSACIAPKRSARIRTRFLQATNWVSRLWA